MHHAPGMGKPSVTNGLLRHSANANVGRSCVGSATTGLTAVDAGLMIEQAAWDNLTATKLSDRGRMRRGWIVASAGVHDTHGKHEQQWRQELTKGSPAHAKEQEHILPYQGLAL